MNLSKIPYKRPLVIGTGGGNDIVSATLVLSDLINAGKKPDLAGLCSPAAWHNYELGDEKPINIVTDKTSRLRPSKNPKELSFIDPKIPGLLRKEGIDSAVYHLSCKYGTLRLIQGLENLIKIQGYDGIVAVDVGGDILARGKQDPTILSPLMDFTTLYVLSQIKTPSILIEFGLQTDGELRPKGCEEILRELESSGILKETLQITKEDESVKLMERVYRGIESIRHGHTAAMTLETLSAKEDIHTYYRSRNQVLDKKWYQVYSVELEEKYFGKAFVIDTKKLAKTRPLAFSYKTPLEMYLKTKKMVDTKTEMDLLYAWSDNNCIWLGCLYPQIQGKDRREVLSYGLDRLEEHADLALLWEKDKDAIPSIHPTSELDGFVLVGYDREKISQVSSRIKDILSETRS